MKDTALKAAVLSISLLTMSAGAASPVLANISKDFPEINPSTIMLITTLPSIVMVVFSLVYGKLVEFFKKKTLFVIAMFFFLIGGIVPAFLNDITWILVVRGVFGISLGFLTPMSTALITDFYQGHERETMMGLQSAFVNMGGILFSLVGGLLGAINWHYAFLTYFLGSTVLIFVLFKLREPEKMQKSAMGNDKLPRKVYLLQLSLLVYNLLLFAFMTNIAIIIVDESLGNAAGAGIVLTLFTVGGLVGGFVFGKVIQIFNRFTAALGWIVTGGGFAFLALSHGLNLIMAGSIIAGMGLATTMPAIYIKISHAAPPPALAFSFALAISFMGVGQFISPFVFELVGNLFGQGPGRFPIIVSSVGLLVIGLTMVLNILRSPKLLDVNREH